MCVSTFVCVCAWTHGYIDLYVFIHIYIYIHMHYITFMCMYICDLQSVIHLFFFMKRGWINDLQPLPMVPEVPGAGECFGEEPESGTAPWKKNRSCMETQ